MTNNDVYIYCLKCPDSRDIRYIGKANNLSFLERVGKADKAQEIRDRLLKKCISL